MLPQQQTIISFDKTKIKAVPNELVVEIFSTITTITYPNEQKR